jgi:hypothetical protein
MRTKSQLRAEAAIVANVSSEEEQKHAVNDIAAAPENLVAFKQVIECPVCYTNPRPEDVAEVCGCNHKFCFGCIDKWGQIKNSCPLCNGTFIKVKRGTNQNGDIKTYSGTKRKRDDTLVEERFAGIQARIEANDRRQVELQRQIDEITRQRDQLRVEADRIRVRIELQRLRMQSLQMETTGFMLQRAEIERMIARIRDEIAQVDSYIESGRNNDIGGRS